MCAEALGNAGKHRRAKKNNQQAPSAARATALTETKPRTAAQLTTPRFSRSDSFHPLSVYGALG